MIGLLLLTHDAIAGNYKMRHNVHTQKKDWVMRDDSIELDDLSITNSLSVSGYQFPTENGTSGQVMKSDGGSVITWEDDLTSGGNYWDKIADGIRINVLGTGSDVWEKVVDGIKIIFS